MSSPAQPYAEAIGRSETHHDIITPRLVESLMATLDDPRIAKPGDPTPQATHFLLCPVIAPMQAISSDGHPRKGGFLPDVPLPRRMWAASAITFHAPLRVDDQVEMTASIASVTPKTGKSGEMVFVEVDRHYAVSGRLCVHERQSIVYRGEETGTAPPAPTPAPFRPSDWTWSRSLVPDPVLLFRYSAMTFNGHRIHYDLPYVRDEEGYPGLVVHGPLTATLLLDLARRSLGENRLKTFTFRARSPAFSGAVLHLAGRMEGETLMLNAFGEDGRLVMSAESLVEA